jgi:hypothetical protein
MRDAATAWNGQVTHEQTMFSPVQFCTVFQPPL